ncbi:MAG: hypothetical protein WC795_01700 [Candidatus Paceibacterota bacterium]|jgi:tetrahydromethanopterin S-methyltransferase subunit G
MKKSPLKKKKEMTIEDLAGMVAKGFIGVDSRLDKVDSRLDKVDSRLDKVESRLDKVESRLTDVEESVRATRRDVLNIGDRVVSQHSFDQLATRVYNLEKRIPEKKK